MRYLLIAAGLALAFVNACSSPRRSGGCNTVKNDDISNAHRGRGDIILTSLADSLVPLQDRFNMDKGKPRLVALLSPT